MENGKNQEERAPQCELLWERDHFVLACETAEDQDRAAKALQESETVIVKRAEAEEERAPRCEARWEGTQLVVECETEEDQDRAIKALEKNEVVVTVKAKKVKKEG